VRCEAAGRCAEKEAGAVGILEFFLAGNFFVLFFNFEKCFPDF
jgi:hypothetical protein